MSALVTADEARALLEEFPERPSFGFEETIMGAASVYFTEEAFAQSTYPIIEMGEARLYERAEDLARTVVALSETALSRLGLSPVVYTKVQREGGREFWTRIGRARVNPDGSLSLDLYALPVSGVIEVRRADERSGT